ncbi:MAG TPA: putative lipid II flippase FtsW [Patescibacteria group bacterium]|nr:putative lipid II flippase FtsW [Patescibacteria group bacterium]
MKRIDPFLLITTIFLTFFGLFMIYDASSFVAFRDFGDKYHYLKEQSFWIILGFISLSFFTLFNYKKFYNLALPILVISLVFLLLVFIPGLGVSLLGARRWVNFGFILFQPSEFIKLALAIYLSAWFSNKEKGRLWSFLLLLGFIFSLIMLQPDMGTAVIILAEAFIIFFLSGGKISYFFFIAPVIAFLGYILIKIEPYRANRLATFLNFNSSPDNFSYHVRQILIAFGSGGLFGVGFGNSLQKYAYLPENTTDSIFAIIGEELGFVGATLIIFLFILLIWRGFYIAANTKDMFGKLLAGGITSFLAFQILINLAAQTALLPLTGVPLPLISYGGSALIMNLTAIGILLNIGRQGHNK